MEDLSWRVSSGTTLCYLYNLTNCVQLGPARDIFSQCVQVSGQYPLPSSQWATSIWIFKAKPLGQFCVPYSRGVYCSQLSLTSNLANRQLKNRTSVSKTNPTNKKKDIETQGRFIFQFYEKSSIGNLLDSSYNALMHLPCILHSISSITFLWKWCYLTACYTFMYRKTQLLDKSLEADFFWNKVYFSCLIFGS